MNIGFWRYSLYNRGGDRLSLEYANYLAEAGHHVTLYVADLNTVFWVSPHLVIKKIADHGRAFFLIQSAYVSLNHDIVIVDIIHLALPLSLQNRVIYYAQADDVEYYSSSFVRGLIDRTYGWYFRSSRPYISMSQHLSGIFEKRYGIPAPYTVRTGIDHALFYPDPDSDLCASKNGKQSLVFMARGDIYRKGFDIAREVFRFLGSTMPELLEVWVCGETFEAIDGVAIKNFGHLTDIRLRQVLSSADLFFYPSRHEGFGLFPLEAMACGAVAITTDAVPYARTTLSMQVFDIGGSESMAKCIANLISDAELLNKLKRQALKDAAGYDHAIGKSDFARFVVDIVNGGIR